MLCLLTFMYILRHRGCTNTSAGVTGLQLTKSDHILKAFL